jgi:hypothetical protein
MQGFEFIFIPFQVIKNEIVMKKLYGLLCFLIVCGACSNDDDSGTRTVNYKVAVPETASLADFRSQTEVQEPKIIEQSGKIYAYQNYIFINDDLKGVHILDNRSPESPVKKYFLKIPRNTDVAVRNDKLYANSGRDLVVFDIGNIDQIEIDHRLENVFEPYQPPVPSGVSSVDYRNVDFSSEIITGYTTRTETREVPEGPVFNAGPAVGDASGSTGTGGSLARFKIVDNFLYTVSPGEIDVFNIQNTASPQRVNSINTSFNIETIFNQGDFLYLGSPNGMFIYKISDRRSPEYISNIRHVVGCDPVVVQDDKAYVTIRGGNNCGQELSQLEVIDISDKTDPQVEAVYELTEPYGLGIKNDLLFVCDGSQGLKIYDAQQTPELFMLDHFEDIETFDVIPLEEILLMVGGEMLYQYEYNTDGIELISTFSLN